MIMLQHLHTSWAVCGRPSSPQQWLLRSQGHASTLWSVVGFYWSVMTFYDVNGPSFLLWLLPCLLLWWNHSTLLYSHSELVPTRQSAQPASLSSVNREITVQQSYSQFSIHSQFSSHTHSSAVILTVQKSYSLVLSSRMHFCRCQYRYNWCQYHDIAISLS